MSIKSTENKYGSRAVMFHWFAALLILSMIPLGMYMHELPKGDFKANLYKAHIVIGGLVFLLTLARLVWKFLDNKVAELQTTSKFTQFLSKAMHYLLNLIVLVASISGLSYTIASGLGEQLFTANSMIWPNAHDFTPAGVHGVLTKLLIPLLILHILAALYHQYIVKDEIFKRMSFKD